MNDLESQHPVGQSVFFYKLDLKKHNYAPQGTHASGLKAPLVSRQRLVIYYFVVLGLLKDKYDVLLIKTFQMTNFSRVDM